MSKYIDKIKRNIFVGYIYNFFVNFSFTSAIWVLYLSSKGLSLIEIGIVESIFHITSLICEVPTGAIADLYGRKFSVILGRVFAIISTILMINSTTIAGFSVAFIFSALSYNLNSGSEESLIYDTLKQINSENDYKKISGNIFFLTEIAQGMAVILGGLLSDIGFIYAYLVSLIIELVSFIITFNFTEPKFKEESNGKRETFITQMISSVKILWNNKNVLYLIIFFELMSTIGTTVFFYSQKHFDNMHFSKTLIALIFTSSSVVNAFGSKYAYKIEKKLKAKGVIILTPILNLIALIGLALSNGFLTIIFFIISALIQSFSYPIFSDYINSLIPSEYRATILSLQSVCFSVFMIVFFPLVGFAGEKFGLSKSFIIAALVFIPCTIFIVLKLNKHATENQQKAS